MTPHRHAMCHAMALGLVLGCWASPSLAAQRWPDEPERAVAGDAALLRHATINGVEIAYRVEGRGVPVVFVHGEGVSHEVWSAQLTAIADRYLAVAYDRRGHGESEAPFTGYSPFAHVEDLRGLLSYLGVDSAHFVVHSRGGAIILQFLRLYPSFVRSVVFADATIPLVELTDVFRETVSRYRLPAPTRDEALAQRELRKRAPFYAVARSRPDVRVVLERMIDQQSLRVATNPHRASDLTSTADIGPWNAADFPDMAPLGRSVLVIVGVRSDPFFQEGARYAQKAWPGVRVESIDETDHLLMLEEPEEFNRLITLFFAEIDLRRNPRGQVGAAHPRASRLRLSGVEREN
jgi:3-oxoadipate enol-lactonase